MTIHFGADGNSLSSGYVGGRQVVKYSYDTDTTHRTYSNSWADTGLEISFTPASSSSKLVITAFYNLFASPVQATNTTTWGKFWQRIQVGGSTVGEEQKCSAGLGHSGYYSHYAAWKQWQFTFQVVYVNSNTSAKTVKAQLKEESGVLELNKENGLSYLTILEVE